MHNHLLSPCSPLGQNIQPEDRCILIAIGQFGRQVLWEQDGLLSSFAIRAEIWPELRCLIDRAGSVGLVAAAGGVAGSMLTLRLAQEACWANKRVTVALSTPFSWEERRRYWRSIYVLARLRQLGGCDLSVVHTSRMEAMALPGELLRTTLFRLTRQAASARYPSVDTDARQDRDLDAGAETEGQAPRCQHPNGATGSRIPGRFL